MPLVITKSRNGKYCRGMSGNQGECSGITETRVFNFFSVHLSGFLATES